MVVNQPTWGVDAGAAAHIRQALIELARSGSAVLVISQDLDELFEISDAIAVMHNGELSKPLPHRRGDLREDRPADGRRRARPRRTRAGDGMMRIELVKRPQRSTLFSALSPFIALRADAHCRRDHVRAARREPARLRSSIYFIEPLSARVWQLHELAIKAAPLILIAVGLSVCYLANNWNIGAEGQFILGAHCRLDHPGAVSRVRRPGWCCR